jgi:hypothetical protein
MVPIIDTDYGVYAKGPDGDWHFSLEYFGKYLERENITWPLTDKGKLSTKRKTFEDMAKGHSQLEGLRQLRHAQHHRIVGQNWPQHKLHRGARPRLG